jgi:bacterioferritin-associated ferredoxin
VCFDLRFSELKKKLDERPATLDEIGRRYGCGACCGMCRPYIERMLETGETVFHEILTGDRGDAAAGSTRSAEQSTTPTPRGRGRGG